MANPLPIPDSDALAHSHRLEALISKQIEEAGGWLDFASYMHLALYSPGLGYYSGGALKFGASGDFVTAPEISPLFARTLARQATPILQETQGSILELGAGSGKLCAQMLLELHRLDVSLERYLILEVSAYLRELQQQNLKAALPAQLFEKVQWLDALPASINGLVLANEVLDALPVHVIHTAEHELMQLGVIRRENAFEWETRPLGQGSLFEAATRLQLPRGYRSEICLAATGLMASLGNMLQQGVILLIDYGFPRHEYYHAQRSEGTLMCHYRHHAHGDPFLYLGLQDITAHVDFTAVAEAGVMNGLHLIGFTSQAQFLINCGIADLLNETSPENLAAFAPLAAQAQRLLSPAEMGELFKVIALGKDYPTPLLGFTRGDKRHKL